MTGRASNRRVAALVLMISVVVGACSGDSDPAADPVGRDEPTSSTSASTIDDSATGDPADSPGTISDDDVDQIERQLDDIEKILDDLDTELSQD